MAWVKRRLPLYLTEYGYFRSGARKVSESKRAKYLVQGFEIALHIRPLRDRVHWFVTERVEPNEQELYAGGPAELQTRVGECDAEKDRGDDHREHVGLAQRPQDQEFEPGGQQPDGQRAQADRLLELSADVACVAPGP